MKKILALIICFATILTSLSFVSCGKTLHYKDGNYYCSQNGVTYKEVSFEYFPVAIGEKYAKLKDTQTGKEIELFEIQGADPEKWLSTENGTLYCAIDEKIPTMNEMKVDRIVLCYEGVVVMALATITDEVDVAYILGRFNNGNVLERPLGNESESVYRLRMTSDDYSWIYYNLSYMEYAEDITECDYPTDMNTYVYRDVDDSVKINEFSEYECWYAVSSKSEESKYIDIAQKSGTHYTTVTKPNGDGTFTDYVRFVFSSAQSTEECVETIVKNYKNGSMTEGALHDALDEPDKSERINIVEYNYGKYFIYDRITGKCVNVDERIFNYREGKVEGEDRPRREYMISYVVSGLAPDMIPSVAELERKCFSAPVSEEGLRSLYVGGIGKGFVCIEPDNRTVLAYGGVMCAADEAQVLNIATCPEYRRNGLARAILSAILEYSEENGAEFITLEVRESNASAMALYKGNGFYEVGRLKNYYKAPTEDGLILKKDLSLKTM